LLFRLGVFIGLQIAALSAPAAGHSYRPALVGNGPKSLVNLIDGQKLIEKGQQDGVVMFDVIVNGSDGSADLVWCHGPREVKLLKTEVQRAALNASFVPALIDGKPVDVAFHGAAIFVVREGHPYLKIFANQDADELARQTDYIQPQLVPDSTDWDAAKPMLEVVRRHARTGHAILSITLEADGKVRDRHLLEEDPPGLNIGAAALKAYANARFVPGFRNGKPVACTFKEDWAVRGYVYRRW
jgi:hypothetical protein